MASYEKFAEDIGKGEIVSAYTNILNDVNYCINLFDDLEVGRTRTEGWYDYFAGERDQIELQNLPGILETLKKEVEVGLRLYMKLSCQMQIYSKQNSQDPNLQSIMHSSKFTPRWGIQQELRSQFADLISAVAEIKRPEIKNNGWGNYIPGVLGYHDRQKQYSNARILYQTLNQDKILNVLKENHASIRELVECADDAIHNVIVPKQYHPTDTSAEDSVNSGQSPEDTEQTDHISDGALNQDYVSNNSPIENIEPRPDNSNIQTGAKVELEQVGLTEPTDCSQNSGHDIDGNDLANAKKEYNDNLVAELEQLESEKGMSEETRY